MSRSYWKVFLWNKSHFILLLYTDIPTGTSMDSVTMLVVWFQTKYCFRIAAAQWVIFCNNQPLMRGQRSSVFLRLHSLVWIILESELLHSVSPLWCDTLKLQHGGSPQRDFWRLSFVYRCIFFFALQSVASGIKAQTHTEADEWFNDRHQHCKEKKLHVFYALEEIKMSGWNIVGWWNNSK